MMATSDDGCSFIEMDDEGCKASVGHPSYKDLLEENKYLRSVLSKLYEQAAPTPMDESGMFKLVSYAGQHNLLTYPPKKVVST